MVSAIMILLLVALGGSHASGLLDGNHDVSLKNKEDVMLVSRFVDNLAKDLEDNWNHVGQTRNMTEDIANKLLDFVSKTNQQTTDKINGNFQKMQSMIDQNIKELASKNAQSHQALKDLTQDNDKTIAESLTTALNTAMEEMEARLKQHEDLLSTKVAVCGETFSHLRRGRVSYQNMFMDSVAVRGVPVRGETVLLKDQGYFKVPQAEGADGTYHISFGVIIDTIDNLSGRLSPAVFALEVTQSGRTRMLGHTKVTSKVGRPDEDYVPASRQVLLSLQAGDTVSLWQLQVKAEMSYRLTFCAHLVHPTTPSTWSSLTSLPSPNMATKDTYEEPVIEAASVDASHVDVTLPDVHMPDLPAMRSPGTFFPPSPVTARPVDSPDAFDLLGDNNNGVSADSASDNKEAGDLLGS